MALTAMYVWIFTALVGAYMLGMTLRIGAGASDVAESRWPFSLPVAHLAFGVSGLALWIAYLLVDRGLLAWLAFADLVLVATLGDLLLVRWLKGRSTPAGRDGTTQLVEQRIPGSLAAVHGTLAVLTVLLVFLAALGVG